LQGIELGRKHTLFISKVARITALKPHACKNKGSGDEKQPHKVVTARHSSMVHLAKARSPRISGNPYRPLQILQKSNHLWSTTHTLQTIPHNKETATGTTIQTGRDCRHST
jgi:hypothetical protein